MLQEIAAAWAIIFPFFYICIQVRLNLGGKEDFGWNYSSHQKVDTKPKKKEPNIYLLEPGEFPCPQNLGSL